MILSPFVAGLLTGRGPADVSRLVVAVVITAVYGMLWTGARADVFQEGREGVAPATADLDSSAAPLMEPSRVRIEATLFHSAPRRILWAESTAMGAISVSRFGRSFLLETATTEGESFNESRISRLPSTSTRATAENIGAAIGGSSFCAKDLHNREPSELLAGPNLHSPRSFHGLVLGCSFHE